MGTNWYRKLVSYIPRMHHRRHSTKRIYPHNVSYSRTPDAWLVWSIVNIIFFALALALSVALCIHDAAVWFIQECVKVLVHELHQ
jgi:hypothetical protein